MKKTIQIHFIRERCGAELFLVDQSLNKNQQKEQQKRSKVRDAADISDIFGKGNDSRV